MLGVAVAALAIALFGLGAAFDVPPSPVVISLTIVAPITASAIWVAQVPLYRIRTGLDAVGLVTLRKVHPNFVAAVGRWRSTNPHLNHQA